MVLAPTEAHGSTTAPARTRQERAARLFPPASGRRTDLVIERAQGVTLWADDGRKFLDFAGGIAVTNVGHNHPEVLKAAHAQMDALVHVGHNIALCPPYIDLAEKLVELVGGDRKVFFSNSGAEALEAGIKLAMRATGRSGLIAFKRSFHGRTLAMTSLSASSARYRTGYHGALPSVTHVDFPSTFLSGRTEEEEVARCLAQLDETFALLLEPSEVAAIVVEPFQGEGGYIPAPAAFLRGLRERADKHGIALIFDEVQSGFGRTGRMFAFQHSGVAPDVIALAKGIANGFPLSAMVATSALMDKWPAGAHGGTYGGNPVACAASLAVINILENGAIANAERVGAELRAGLEALAATVPLRSEVRGLGIMLGVEFRDESGAAATDFVSRICANALGLGLLLLACGAEGNVIRLMPPTTLTSDEAAQALDLLGQAISAAAQ